MAIKKTNFKLPKQTTFYKGKVRDVYTIGDEVIMVVTDRISAFDHVLPRPIPYKGQVLTQIAQYFLEESKDICPNWFESCPSYQVMAGKKCEPLKVEMVVRGYLAGHAWREYQEGKRSICGVALPDDMVESESFPQPIITPSTKADQGHDEDISKEEILKQGLVAKDVYEKIEAYSLALFERGSRLARDKGLILVDTKYEFGICDGEVYLIDEIHTPDSSRYYYFDEYEERLQKGVKQQQLSKEFVREWLMENEFFGKDGDIMPIMPKSFINRVKMRYVYLHEKLTGKTFIPYELTEEEIEKDILKYLKSK